MRQTRISYYADFAVYPVLIIATTVLIADQAHPAERGRVLCGLGAGAFLWTLTEYLLHRYLLHGTTFISRMHAEHHARPCAWIGTPTWLSVAAITLTMLLAVLLGVRLVFVLGIAIGFMATFLWYQLIHHVAHHGRPHCLVKVMSRAVRRHFSHHRAPHLGNFGVTTSFWDLLFRTVVRVRRQISSAGSVTPKVRFESDTE